MILAKKTYLILFTIVCIICCSNCNNNIYTPSNKIKLPSDYFIANKATLETYSDNQHLKDLLACYNNSPYPSFKVTNYFEIYKNLFYTLRGKECTFIEVGVLNGGSLFMWRSWLGKKARIIGVDLNPAAEKWKAYGFEIYIGDQGDPNFWRNFFQKVGNFDVLLDDGGHQSFQQIVTLTEALKAIKGKGIIVVEDTITSYLKDFSQHGKHNFLKFSKDATDNLVVRLSSACPQQSEQIKNLDSVESFQKVHSIEFFPGIVAFKIDPIVNIEPKLIWNHQPLVIEPDYRYAGATSSAKIDWPNPFMKKTVVVKGKKSS